MDKRILEKFYIGHFLISRSTRSLSGIPMNVLFNPFSFSLNTLPNKIIAFVSFILAIYKF